MHQTSGNDRTTLALRGSLVDTDGRPLAGERVHLLSYRRVWSAHPETRVLNGREWVQLATAISDARGLYLISEQIEVSRTNWLQLVVMPKELAMAAVRVGPASKEVQPITLAPPCRIEGAIRSVTGQPVAGANVRLTSVHAMFGRSWQLETRQASHDHGRAFQAAYWPDPVLTDEDGKFTLSCVPEGAVATLEVCADGYAAQSIKVATDTALDRFTDSRKGWPACWKDEHLPSQFTYVLEPPLFIEGRVFDRNTGEPMPGIEVLVSGIKRECGGMLPVYSRSGIDGIYRISVRPCDSYVTHAFAPLGHFPYSQTVMGSDVASQSTSQGAYKQDFALGRGPIIGGRVINEATGEPVCGASVVYVRCRQPRPRRFRDVPEQARVLTDRRGEYRLTAQPGRGAIVVEAPPGGYVRRAWNHRDYCTNEDAPHGTSEVDVPSGDQGEWRVPDIAVRRGVPLRLRIRGFLGLPILRGRASCPELRENFHARWDWDNTFLLGSTEFTGAEPGKSYRVLIGAAGGRRGVVADVIAPRDLRPVVVHLKTTAKIRGRLTHANGRPAAGISLFPMFWTNLREMLDAGHEPAVVQEAEFYANFERSTGTCVTRADGRFALRGIVAGLPMILCLNEHLASGLNVHPIGMLKPRENRNLGDLVLAD